jgi:asparagine synthase (glutamine-hydrolysing)
MAIADGRLTITFNGDIYNYRELRRELEASGIRFRSGSDTEVLLHLFAEHGPRAVEMLRGMFAFAIWSASDRTLFLARDPFGIKPLYYTDDGVTLRFASQVKALLSAGGIDRRPNPAGSVGFFLWGAVPEPHTLFEGIRALPAGTHVLYRPGNAGQPRQYFSIVEELARGEAEASQPSEEEQLGWLRETLMDSVRHHLVADVPMGVFLSAGLDSTTLTAIASEIQGSDLRSLTLGFREYQGTHADEVPLAEEVARRYGTLHCTSWVSESDFTEALPGLLEAMDQPTTNGVNTYLVSRAAAQAGMKVALSGLGGDELFGGYPSFRQVPRMATVMRPFQALPALGRAVRRLTDPLLRVWTSPKYAGLAEYGGSYAGAYLLRRALYAPWEIDRFMDPTLVKEGLERLNTIPALRGSYSGLGAPRQRVAALELAWYMRNQLLRDADWAGMAHSLEIRVPFVDVQLLRRVAPLLGRSRPPTQKLVASTPRLDLPRGLLLRPKTGFSTPVSRWITRASPRASHARGLRGWAFKVHPRLANKRILALVTDAFGGHGGIALYGRDLLESICGMPACAEVVAVPRVMPNAPEPLPAQLRYVTGSLNSKWSYVRTVLRLANPASKRFDLVICGHVNLLPAAYLAARAHRAPLMLVIYGIEAWEPVRSAPTAWLARRTALVVSISELTLNRFIGWTGVDPARSRILPNAIHLERYGPGPKPPVLMARYGLSRRTVLMTVGRMVSIERYKGFDEVLDVLPRLVEDIPDVAYLCVGDGSDAARLRRKAASLGLADRVVFTGNIPESEKADHYRLADAYVMPSRGEGFGYVLLEAMASGVPVVASRVDGGREALRNGALGELVDPNDPEDIARGIKKALGRPRGIPGGLEYFSYSAFQQRLQVLLDELLAIRQDR